MLNDFVVFLGHGCKLMASPAPNAPETKPAKLITEVNRMPFGIAVRLQGDEKKRFWYAPTPEGVSIGNVTMEITKSAGREGFSVDSAKLYEELLPLVKNHKQ